jgi:hypothetical protein
VERQRRGWYDEELPSDQEPQSCRVTPTVPQKPWTCSTCWSKFFDDGDRWIKGKLDDGAGNRSLVGALRDIWDGHNLHGAPTRIYLLKAMQRSPKTGWTGLILFNDRCRDFGELREVILQARKLAIADIEKHQHAVPTSELLAA